MLTLIRADDGHGQVDEGRSAAWSIPYVVPGTGVASSVVGKKAAGREAVRCVPGCTASPAAIAGPGPAWNPRSHQELRVPTILGAPATQPWCRVLRDGQ